MVTIKRPTLRDAEEFLRAVQRSRSLHKGLVSPPGDLEAYRRYINTLRQRNRVGFVVIAAAGVLGVFGQLLMTSSYRYAEASTIAPLDYTSLLAVLILGYVFFDETPELSTWIGAPLVIAAGLISLWREYVRVVPDV